MANYRDPILSERWLWEAEWRATNPRGNPKLTQRDACKIILRLVQEVRRLNKENKKNV